MIEKFNVKNGVPVGHYYLVNVISFADFEVYQQEIIIAHSASAEELEEFARDNQFDLDPGIYCWQTSWITQRINDTNEYLNYKVVRDPNNFDHYKWIVPNGGAYAPEEPLKPIDRSDLYLSEESIADMRAWTKGANEIG